VDGNVPICREERVPVPRLVTSIDGMSQLPDSRLALLETNVLLKSEELHDHVDVVGWKLLLDPGVVAGCHQLPGLERH
jgi:hypothetical protein